MMSSSLLEDADRPPLVPSSAAKSCAAAKISNQALKASHHEDEFSLGRDFLDNFMKSAPEPGPSEYLRKPLLWLAVQEFRFKLHELGRLWCNLIPIPGSILIHKDDLLTPKGLVLASTQHGVLTLAVRWHEAPGDRYIVEPEAPGEDTCMPPIFLQDLADWFCVNVTFCSPLMLRSHKFPPRSMAQASA